jgi:hypothetical protein
VDLYPFAVIRHEELRVRFNLGQDATTIRSTICRAHDHGHDHDSRLALSALSVVLVVASVIVIVVT